VIEIPIQSLIKSVNIEVNGEITYLDGRKEKVRSAQTISFNLYENQDIFTNMYLRNDNERGYSILVAG